MSIEKIEKYNNDPYPYPDALDLDQLIKQATSIREQYGNMKVCIANTDVETPLVYEDIGSNINEAPVRKMDSDDIDSYRCFIYFSAP